MKVFGTILFLIILSELILGGGGRFTAFGPVSLRMVLFSIALIYTAYRLWSEKRVTGVYFRLTILFIVVTVFSILIGLLSGADQKLIFEDVKPLSYFLMLPFFALTITDLGMIERISKLIIYGALFLSIMYLVTIATINTGIISFPAFYKLTAPSEEIFYRGELAFFYKGFIFLCIGLIFIYFYRPKYAWLMAGLILLTIILTFTRGFIFALLLTAFVYLIIKKSELKYKALKLTVAITCTLMIAFKGNQLYAEVSKMIYESNLKPEFTREFEPDKLLGNRDFSNNERKKQLIQVLERTTFTSVLIGHGFGIGVPVRPIHMEISYLEIFHKQGLWGLLFWALIFYLLTEKFLQAPRQSPHLAKTFYFGCLFIFFQSMTNQYFNNPIGMAFILIALVSLDVISKSDV